MEPVPLIFSCDTEDYETPAADDAELLWARLFAGHDIRAAFCVVGEEARALRDRGRRDVLEALAGHEIASHSNRHSAHPTPAEYLEPLSWNEGVQSFLAEEAGAVRDLVDILGQQPKAWCKPGNSWGPAVPYAAALLGMPVFCDAPFEWTPGHPMRFAGGLLLKYHIAFDRYFDVPAAERPVVMRTDFEALLASRRAAAEREGGTPGTIVMYTHPSRTVTSAFPDNFTAGKQTPREDWRPAPLRARREVEALVRDFDAFLTWIASLRAAGEIVLTTYDELHRAHRQPVAPWLTLDDVVDLARALAEDDASIGPRCPAGAEGRAGPWLTPAEQIGALLWALAHYGAAGSLPGQVPVRRLLGPVDGESGPPSADAPSAVGLADLLRAATVASEACTAERALPATVRVGAAMFGPGRSMRLAARALVVIAAGGRPAGLLPVPSGGDLPALAGRADFARLRFRDTWSVFPPEFEGRRLIEQTRRQTWSAAPAGRPAAAPDQPPAGRA